MSEILEPSSISEFATGRDSPVMPGFNSNGSWELAQRIGKAFAASSLVPEAYRGNLANCIVALEMANRMGASPLLVMQNLYLVHGNPGWSSKFLIACFNQSGKYTAMRYRWNADRTGCRAWAIEKATGEELVGPEVTIKMAQAEGWSKKSGSKWLTMPELMLTYRAAAFMIRTYAPEISMGLRTDDEIRDTISEVQPAAGGGLAAVRAAISAAPAPALPSTAAPNGDPDPETGEVQPPAPAAAPATPAMTFAMTSDRIKAAGNRETALLALDSAELPDDQRAELARMVDRTYPEKA